MKYEFKPDFGDLVGPETATTCIRNWNGKPDWMELKTTTQEYSIRLDKEDALRLAQYILKCARKDEKNAR